MNATKYILLSAFLVLLLCGCTTGDGRDEDQETPDLTNISDSGENEADQKAAPEIDNDESVLPQEPFDADEPSEDALYQTTVFYDQETKIQRTTLDTQGLSLSVYFEIPVFGEDTEGYRNIDSFFIELNRSFFSEQNTELASVYEYAESLSPDDGMLYSYERPAEIRTHTESLLSVSIYYNWWMGGVFDNGSDSYTFDVQTGKLLSLRDLIQGTDEEIKSIIIKALEEEDAGQNFIEFDRVGTYDLDDFEFYVEDGAVWINFDKYEASFGAYGAFSVKLPVKISF